MTDIKIWFTQELQKHEIDVTDRQWEQFELYYRELVSWNERMNLTSITEKDQVFIKHFFDSATLSFFVPITEARTIADIGSGAGFPSIPLKILFPELRVTIVDSLQKRIGFLEALKQSLGLEGVTCIHGRAEDVARQGAHRDQYDLVTARAVARLNVLSEFCLPFVRPGGVFAAMKGSDPTDEVEEAAFAVKELGGKVASNFSFELPLENSRRHIIVVRKTKPTSKKYPRKAGMPLKSPLIPSN